MIESVTYQKDPFDSSINGALLMVEDGVPSSVPIDPANRHYLEIQEWVADGNTIAEPE